MTKKQGGPVTTSKPAAAPTSDSELASNVSDSRHGRPSVGGILRRVTGIDEFGPLLALISLVVIIGVFHSQFLEKTVLLNTARSAAFVGIAAYGMVFLLAMTEIDLSVGGVYAVTVILAAKWMSSVNPWLAAGLAILAAVALGAFNGVLANVFRLPVIIVTLGTLSMFRGLTQVISDGRPATGIPVESNFFSTLGGNIAGVPTPVWIAVVVGAVLTFVFKKTRFGAMVRATGSNRQAAEFSGIPTQRIRLYALMLVAGLAGLAGILTLAYLEGADPSIGGGYELQVIAAVIIGGTAISGGSGTVFGALIGALIVAVINSGLIFFSIDSNWTDFVTGSVIVLAVGSDALIRRRRMTRALRDI